MLIQIGNHDLCTIFDVMSLDDYVHVVLRRNNYACNTSSVRAFCKNKRGHVISRKTTIWLSMQYVISCIPSIFVFWLWNIQIHILTPFLWFCRPHFNSSHIQWFILHLTNNEPFVITRSWYAWNSSIENLKEIHIKFQYISDF